VDTGNLKKFAQNARRTLIEQVGSKLSLIMMPDSMERREYPKAIAELTEKINGSSREQMIEKVAYTWFNRFCALRFMDVNRYNRVGVISPKDGQSQPELLAEAKMGMMDESIIPNDIQSKVNNLLTNKIPSTDPQGEAYRILIVAVCNYYNRIMPFLFEKIVDYTELLMPSNLLTDNSILSETREAMTDDACKDVEVIGWLYQFYISEKKDMVFEDLKKNKKITPENIPAATQLFTPHWIVRYLVENSLGRLWMLNHPGSKLIDKMEYYIKPVEEEKDFLRVSSPEELKICDPASGSGHMLTYAFDLLYQIYEEEGYQPSEIPEKILTYNLYGIEIDERAGELAAFALTMKARNKYRRFFSKPIQPNICVLENVIFEEGELKPYIEKLGRNLFTSQLQETLHQFSEVDNFGSLIQPLVHNVEPILIEIKERRMGQDLFSIQLHNRILKVLKYVEYLSPRYHVVIANPPYMGSKGMNQNLKKFAQNNYKNSKSDLFSMFIERIMELVINKGSMGIMSPFTWMFLSSYEKLRSIILNKNILSSLVKPSYTAFFQSAIVPICAFLIDKKNNQNFEGSFFDLGYLGNAEEQPKRFLDAKKGSNAQMYYQASASDLKKIPGSPIAYWASKNMYNCFSNKAISKYAISKAGIVTGEDDLFLKCWYEISMDKISYTENKFNRKSEKWVPINKGGDFRKYYGNNNYIINIYDLWLDGKATSSVRRGDPQFYFKDAITWSMVTSSKRSFRISVNKVFGVAAPAIFLNDNHKTSIVLGFLNSKVSDKLLLLLNQTLNVLTGDIMRLPFKYNEKKESSVNKNIQGLIDNSKFDWDSYEISWDFTGIRLLNNYYLKSTLGATYQKLYLEWLEIILEMQKLEEENNSIFIEAYGLQDELTPDVPLKEITLTCNPHYRYRGKKTEEELEALLLTDTMKEFISYAVGCMFGRYSLDKPGLILANQGEGLEDYIKKVMDIPEQAPLPSTHNLKFEPDEDNVIPVLDEGWFTDDITERFFSFLKVTFGKEKYEENLKFIEDAIGKSIRNYFLKDFYNHHIKMYKKRPIYWMFSSPKGNFNTLIYMHRYRPDTISIILNDYLREFHTKLTARKGHMEQVDISASASQIEKTKALKEIEKLKKVINELEDYERDTLYPLATRQINIDLDDGVKVNYNKFGTALKNVSGLTKKT